MNDFEDQEYTKQFDLEIWKKIFKYTKNCKKAIFLLLLNITLIAVVDAIFPLLSKYAIDYFVVGKDLSKMLPFILIVIVLTIINGTNIYRFIHYAGVVENTITRDIRKAAFENLQELSFSYYDTTAVGWIMARTVSDVVRIGSLIAWGLVDLLWGVSSVLFYIIFMFNINANLAIRVVIFVPIIFIIGIFFETKILKGQRGIKKINSQITALYNEGITGAKTTKTLVREEKNFKEFSEQTNSMREKSIKVVVTSSIFYNIIGLLGSIATALVLTKGTNLMLASAISAGTLSAFIMYAGQIFDPINQIARIFSEIQGAQASGERTISLIETVSDITDSKEIIEKYGTYLDPKKENWEPILGDIEFVNVDFSYKTGEKVLENFNLKINKGEKIAIVGETGSGKSTIINIVCRFYEPVNGKLLIDGVDYRERSQFWLHNNLAYVLQTPHLFSGTIMENIRYGKIEATDIEVIEAAKKVDAYDFIMGFEKGFQTEVGEGGGKLSQGERQLISFARAIIGDPKICILDEATSSIDTLTERKIQNAIDTVLKDRTSFIVAHRLSTIENADKILVINKGEISESGTHKELLKLKGHYYNLYTNQFKEESSMALLSE